MVDAVVLLRSRASSEKNLCEAACRELKGVTYVGYTAVYELKLAGLIDHEAQGGSISETPLGHTR